MFGVVSATICYKRPCLLWIDGHKSSTVHCCIFPVTKSVTISFLQIEHLFVEWEKLLNFLFSQLQKEYFDDQALIVLSTSCHHVTSVHYIFVGTNFVTLKTKTLL